MKTEDPASIPSTILVVDDNDQNRELLEAYVQDLPQAKVLSAVDGEEALGAVARERPDLILLDIMMPKMSGFEVCRRLKSDPATRDIPVVMVTALNEVADYEKGIECGCDDFLSKPVNRLELMKRVQSLLRIRHLKAQLDRTMTLIKKVPEP
jgi:CheY-like chemotaxis protein